MFLRTKVNWNQQIHWDQLRSPWIALATTCSPMCYLLSVLAADKTYCTSVNVGQCLSKCSYAVLSSGSCTSPHCTWAGVPRRVPGIACTLPWPGPTNNQWHCTQQHNELALHFPTTKTQQHKQPTYRRPHLMQQHNNQQPTTLSINNCIIHNHIASDALKSIGLCSRIF